MKQNPADVEALMACQTENGETVDEALKNLILVIKENIKVRRFVRYEGVCSAYVLYLIHILEHKVRYI